MLGTRVLWSRPRTFRMIAFDLSRGASRSPLGPESRLGGAILLTDVRWRGKPVAGDRPQALLAALAAGGGRSVRAEELIDLVWGDEAPLNGMKSLQVLVARARNVCGPDAIVRDGAGYRLGAAPGEVDSARLSRLVRDAAAALDRDAAAAAALAAKP